MHDSNNYNVCTGLKTKIAAHWAFYHSHTCKISLAVFICITF